MRNFARGAFFLSGIAGLTFEIVWMRHLGLALGATTLAVATTTAAYMGGLALGSHVGGRFADRLRRPLAWYGGTEFLVGLLGLGIPWICERLPALHSALFGGVEDGSLQAVLRFCLALLVLSGPTVLMGATLPLLARTVTQRSDHVGREVGLLYSLNLAGAVLGAAACGFWWIPQLGLRQSNALAVSIDLGIGLLALGLGRLTAPMAPDAHNGPTPVWRPGGRQLVLLLAATGAAAMSLQVLWTRALGTALGPSTYAFSAILCTYLLGLAIGAAVASRMSAQVTAVRLALTLSLVATAVFTLVGIAWVDDLPLMLRGVILDEKLTVQGLIRSEFILAALSVLPATVSMGALFPLTLTAVVGSEERLGAAVGRAYAINTMGSIIGCFAGVFVLLPLLGVEGGMRAAAFVYIVAALVLAARLEPSVPRAGRVLAMGAATAVGLALVLWPHWNVAQWTSGLYRLSMTRAYFAEAPFEASKIIFHRDGLASTVTVEEEDGVRWIKVNGKIDGSSHGDMPTQELSGLLPMLLHPHPEEVAVVGCGSCVTAGAVLEGGAKRVTLVELEKQVVAAAHLFSEINRSPWDDPRMRIAEDDGRNFMARRGPAFDVIVSEPSNPWMTGAASLFTQEFFELAKTRLKDDGMFVQWLQLYELAPDRIASVLKTFHAAFPNVLVFSAHPDSNDLLMVGSRVPVPLPIAQLESRFGSLREAASRAELPEVADLLALVLFSDKEIRDLPQEVPLNTDDNAYIEFGAPRDLLTFAEDDATLPLLQNVSGRRAQIVASHMQPQPPSPSWLAHLGTGYLHQGMLDDAVNAAALMQGYNGATTAQSEDELKNIREIASLLSGDDRERVVDAAVMQGPSDFSRAVRMYADGDVDAALSYLEERPEAVRQDGKVLFFYGYLLYRKDQYDSARKTLLKARHATDTHEVQPAITYYLARNAFNEGDFRSAVREMMLYRQSVGDSPIIAED